METLIAVVGVFGVIVTVGAVIGFLYLAFLADGFRR